MIKILAIGNSFSQDATAYLHDIARADNINLKVVNLYIGGCSLKTHWDNAMTNEMSYDYELNGQGIGKKISIKEALLEESWDYVTHQQVSGDSGRYCTYYPYIDDLYNYVATYAPQAKQLIHQTWAYETDSSHPDFMKYNNNQLDMYEALTAAYGRVADGLSLGIIPCGTVIQRLRKYPDFDYANGGISLCRDGFHLDYIYGRYAAAATWYQCLTPGKISENYFEPIGKDGVKVDSVKMDMIRDTIRDTIREFSL